MKKIQSVPYISTAVPLTATMSMEPLYGVGSHTAGALLHLCHSGILGLAEHLLITAGTASDDVTDAREEVFHEVGANDGLASHYALIGQNGMPLYGGGCG